MTRTYGQGMKEFSIGDVDVSRVIEWSGPFAPAGILFPSVPDELWRQHQSWLAPDFLDASTGDYQANFQTWVLRSDGRTVLVEPRTHKIVQIIE